MPAPVPILLGDAWPLWQRLSSGKRANVAPFIAGPYDSAWVHVYKDGGCGSTFLTRADARVAAKTALEPVRVVKAKSVHWCGQPLRVYRGTVIAHVRELKGRPRSTVYVVGRGRHQERALITGFAPLSGPVSRALFIGVISPLTPKAKDRKR